MGFVRLILLLTALLLTNSCASSFSRTAHGYGDLDYSYSTDPKPLICNSLFDLVLQFEGPDVEAVTLTAMQPSTRVMMLDPIEVVQQTDSRWLAQGMLLHLPGLWEIEVSIAFNGRERHISFPLIL